MNIVYKQLAELRPYENNPRDNEAAIPYVKNSIKEFGFKVPIVIDSDDVIIAGHMASDSIGMNRILDEWEKEGLEVTRIGGLV